MELIAQKDKALMEGCKERAREAGLVFDDETLEYNVSNRDMIKLSPKVMIPTMYDFWYNDIDVIKGNAEYDMMPHNPYETVINTRPSLSFYNTDNPEWLNIMIFYHVLGHIDFFQNNKYFEHTWDYDFLQKAASEKRRIDELRSKHGRWVDYVIEFALGMDNLVDYFGVLNAKDEKPKEEIDWYFDDFIQEEHIKTENAFMEEIERLNKAEEEGWNFLDDAKLRYPELSSKYKQYVEEFKPAEKDIMEYMVNNSPKLAKFEDKWMSEVINIVRETSLYFNPQIRTKIANEGWASYWHEELFMTDDRISTNEVDFSVINAGVTSIPKVGLNPYAIGLRLFRYLEDQGKDIFDIRTNTCDSEFIDRYIDQEFCDMHKLHVVDKRPNMERGTWEYFIKSKKAEDYKEMILDGMYHPPKVKASNCNGILSLNHKLEGKELYPAYIPNTLMGIEFLWGNTVKLYTWEYRPVDDGNDQEAEDAMMGNYYAAFNSILEEEEEVEHEWVEICYYCQNRKVSKIDVNR